MCVGGGVEESSDVRADVGRGFSIAGVIVEDAVGQERGVEVWGSDSNG